MRGLLLTLCLAGPAACATDDAPRGPTGNTPAGVAAVVVRIGDGDTMDLREGDRVRLVQIDAPELGQGECYAQEALRELEALAPPGTRVGLEADPRLDDIDGYGRLLRYVLAAGRNVNVELVRRGAATPYFHDGARGRYADDLLAALDDARTAGRGMWGACVVDWEPDRQVDTFEPG